MSKKETHLAQLVAHEPIDRRVVGEQDVRRELVAERVPILGDRLPCVGRRVVAQHQARGPKLQRHHPAADRVVGEAASTHSSRPAQARQKPVAAVALRRADDVIR